MYAYAYFEVPYTYCLPHRRDKQTSSKRFYDSLISTRVISLLNVETRLFVTVIEIVVSKNYFYKTSPRYSFELHLVVQLLVCAVKLVRSDSAVHPLDNAFRQTIHKIVCSIRYWINILVFDSDSSRWKVNVESLPSFGANGTELTSFASRQQ